LLFLSRHGTLSALHSSWAQGNFRQSQPWPKRLCFDCNWEPALDTVQSTLQATWSDTTTSTSRAKLLVKTHQASTSGSYCIRSLVV
jgi:hypothetical protein